MGLFTGLLTLPLVPARAVVGLAEQIEREADRQWRDPAAVRRQIADVDAAFEAGQLTEEERDAMQDELVARLLPQNSEVSW